ncbi:MAG: DNA polymerase IV [Patescibacteria group bacterium]
MTQTILHIDFNSFFASAEQQANPFLRGKAIAVGGKPGERTIVSTASREAKARGVKTGISTAEAMRICPELILVPGNADYYSEVSEHFVSILKRYTEAVEIFSIDEAFMNITDITHDTLDALAIVLRIRNDIRRELGQCLTVSVGIAPNKLLAKMASECEKPNGITIVNSGEEASFVAKQSLGAIPGIGNSILRHLEERWGIQTTVDAQRISVSELVSEFHSYGNFIFNAVRGIDTSPVSPNINDPKSIGHSTTLPFDTTNNALLRSTLLLLSEMTAFRLRRHNLSARRITLTVRFGDLSFVSKQFTLTSPTTDGLIFFETALSHLLIIADSSPIRLIGISLHDFAPNSIQLSTDKKTNRRTALLPFADRLRSRFGSRIFRPASVILSPATRAIGGFRAQIPR